MISNYVDQTRIKAFTITNLTWQIIQYQITSRHATQSANRTWAVEHLHTFNMFYNKLNLEQGT